MTKPGTDEARARVWPAMNAAYDAAVTANPRLMECDLSNDELREALTIGLIAAEPLLAFANEQVSAQAIPAGPWSPTIGDKVEVIGKYEDDWRETDAWIAGVRVHDSGEGLDVTLSEQWPIPYRHSREYRGQTDGFRPEELRHLTTPKASAQGVGEVGERKPMKIAVTPEWVERMAELEGDHEVGAGVAALPGMLASMWARRHSISDKEWRDAGPVLLGMALASTPEGRVSDEAGSFARAADYLDGLAKEEDFAKTVAETPADKGLCAIIAAEFRRAAKGLRAPASDEVAPDVSFEVWEDDMLVASADTKKEGLHYLAVYSQDVPVRFVRGETRRTEIARAALNPTPGDAK